MDEDVSSNPSNAELSEDHINIDMDEIENEKVEIENLEDKVEDPKTGMMFDSVDEIFSYYTRYAKQSGFAVAKRTCKKGGDGVIKYLTFKCTRNGKPRIRTSNPVRPRPQTKMDCKARINVILQFGRWVLNSIMLDHNHEMSPGKSRFYKCRRVLNPNVKQRLELNAKAGIRINKSFNSFVIEVVGHQKLPFLEKDARNHVDKVRHLE